MTRQMVGLPSQLGYQIVNDVCKKSNKLSGCCCEAAVLALWEMKLPVNIRAHISNMTFSKDTYKAVFEAADQVYLSSKSVTVAAVAQSLDETLPAFSTQNQPQVAAVGRGQGRGGRGFRGGRGGRGQSSGNRGGATSNNSSGASAGTSSQGAQSKPRGPRHSSVPEALASKMCDRHYRHGDQAFFCLAPLSCPWVNKVIAR